MCRGTTQWLRVRDSRRANDVSAEILLIEQRMKTTDGHREAT